MKKGVAILLSVFMFFLAAGQFGDTVYHTAAAEGSDLLVSRDLAPGAAVIPDLADFDIAWNGSLSCWDVLLNGRILPLDTEDLMREMEEEFGFPVTRSQDGSYWYQSWSASEAEKEIRFRGISFDQFDIVAYYIDGNDIILFKLYLYAQREQTGDRIKALHDALQAFDYKVWVFDEELQTTETSLDPDRKADMETLLDSSQTFAIGYVQSPDTASAAELVLTWLQSGEDRYMVALTISGTM